MGCAQTLVFDTLEHAARYRTFMAQVPEQAAHAPTEQKALRLGTQAASESVTLYASDSFLQYMCVQHAKQGRRHAFGGWF
jgi:hypothetical protein